MIHILTWLKTWILQWNQPPITAVKHTGIQQKCWDIPLVFAIIIVISCWLLVSNKLVMMQCCCQDNLFQMRWEASGNDIATGICVITVYVSLVWMSVLSDIIVLITYVAWSTMYMWLVHWVTAESWNHVIGCFPGIPGNDSGIDGDSLSLTWSVNGSGR